MWVINLYGGPGTGKSTTQAAVFAELKRRGLVAEMMREFVKGPVWDGYFALLEDQVFILGSQYHELKRFERGGVEVVVSDAPILLSLAYGEKEGEAFAAYVKELHGRFKTLDIFLRRVKPFEQKGRVQDETQSRELDAKMEQIVVSNCLASVYAVDADVQAPKQIVDAWLELKIRRAA